MGHVSVGVLCGNGDFAASGERFCFDLWLRMYTPYLFTRFASRRASSGPRYFTLTVLSERPDS